MGLFVAALDGQQGPGILGSWSGDAGIALLMARN